MDYGVITFTSTYGAIYAQKVLKEVAPVQVMPVLREISLGCGIAVRFRPEDLEGVRAALAASTLKEGEYASDPIPGSRQNFAPRPLYPTKQQQPPAVGGGLLFVILT